MSLTNPFIAELIPFHGHYAPRNWAFSMGQLITVSQDEALFGVIGYSFGGENGIFALPNLPILNNNFRYLIAIHGHLPNEEGLASPTLGEMMPIKSEFLPRGWAAADGQLLSVPDNQALFSILGYSFGGNGSTFALPNMPELNNGYRYAMALVGSYPVLP